MRRLTLDVLDARRCPLKRTVEPEVYWAPFDTCGHPGVVSLSLLCETKRRDDFPAGCPLAQVPADDPAAIADAEAQRRKIRWPLGPTALKSRIRRRLEAERAERADLAADGEDGPWSTWAGEDDFQ